MPILNLPVTSKQYEIGFFGLGYETRSINFFLQNYYKCQRTVAIGYSYFQDKYDYQKNKGIFESNGATVREVDDSKFAQEIEQELRKIDTSTASRILIDISVFSRHRLTKALWLFMHRLAKGSLIDVLYNVAKFADPPTISYPIKLFGPIIEELNTFPGRLSLPITMICGIGYEKDKALGAIGNIDPDELILLNPIGFDVQYEEVSKRNNDALFRTYPGLLKLDYEIGKPFSIYADLKSLVSKLLETNRVLILPLGPKILSAVAIVLSAEYFPDVSVWRVSSQEEEVAQNKLPSNNNIEMTIEVSHLARDSD